MHGAKTKKCTHEGCTTQSVRGGLCIRHGAKNPCKHEGCDNHAQMRGLCCRHGAKLPTCKHEGCTKRIVKRGFCRRHGSKLTCNYPGCTNNALVKDKCVRHNKECRPPTQMVLEKNKLCNYSSCTNKAIARGKCRRHDKECRINDSANSINAPVQLICQPTNDESAKRNTSDNDDDSIVHKSYGGTDRPTRVVLTWVRANMSDRKQRRHVHVGMRVKVRFKGSVWYGGITAGVIDRGQKIKIRFDDGTEEVSDFPDGDIIIDDQNNGRHHVDAQAFIPPSSNGDPEEEEEGENDEVEGKDTSAEDNSPDIHVSMVASGTSTNLADSQQTNQNDSHHDSDEEEELGALIYRSSRMAKSIKN